MDDDSKNNHIPFSPGDWVIDRNKPGQPGQYSGNWRKVGPHIMVQLTYPGGGTAYRPLTCLESMTRTPGTISEKLQAGHFGKLGDLRRLITYEKLKGTLHDVIYSMEAAQIDFYPYQFKPVLKFINSPTERLIIADEVGLGKTIESALIWIELQARRQAKRLLVVCPKTISKKWYVELRGKFLLDARIIDFMDLQQEIEILKKEGPASPCILIATYTGLRPPKNEIQLLDEPPDDDREGSPKTNLLRELRHWPLNFSPFDLVIFDEAHYMRNPGTSTFHLGECLSAMADAVLCVSATPVNNSNTDLHSLLRLIDESFFESQGMFEELLEANRPAVQASNALARTPPDLMLLKQSLDGMAKSQFISRSPLFRQFCENLENLDPNNKAHLAKCQDLVEKLNLLGGYVNRTRRVQVKENRPLRVPRVITVEYTPEEMQLYKTILQIVRRRCRLDSRPFHVFQALGLQLRAASCLPMIAQEIREGRFGDAEELFGEALGDDVFDELNHEFSDDILKADDLKELLAYDFEENDSKYKELKSMLGKIFPDEKILIFAYYRPTITYLRRRLLADGMSVTVIHGGMTLEERWDEIGRFKDPKGPRVLISSEVGSEGIDLEFCRVMANYDLPWNPMRVEQRIGRIDRVGQQAQRLSIVNFKVSNTIEERLYDRLHEKLERFANSLGDLEAVIGQQVQQLTIELLSRDLTPDEEQEVITKSERVIEERLLQIQALEESGDALIALADYVQRKIEEDRQKGRYIQPEELEDYLLDFFDREFQGCEINQNTPAEGCLRIQLTFEAQSSLSVFLRDDRSLSARPLRQREFYITFRREAFQRLPIALRRSVHFSNHLSPLIRWITKINREREHSFHNISALLIHHPELPSGDYCYRVERWKLKGLNVQETLAYGIKSLDDVVAYLGETAASIFQSLLRQGKDWDYIECNRKNLLHEHNELEKELSDIFALKVNDFEAENSTVHQIKVQRVKAIFDRRIEQDEQRLRTLKEAGRDPRVIRATEGRLKKAIENKELRIRELNEKAQTEIETSEVAAGVFRVLHPT